MQAVQIQISMEKELKHGFIGKDCNNCLHTHLSAEICNMDHIYHVSIKCRHEADKKWRQWFSGSQKKTRKPKNSVSRMQINPKRRLCIGWQERTGKEWATISERNFRADYPSGLAGSCSSCAASSVEKYQSRCASLTSCKMPDSISGSYPFKPNVHAYIPVIYTAPPDPPKLKVPPNRAEVLCEFLQCHAFPPSGTSCIYYCIRIQLRTQGRCMWS